MNEADAVSDAATLSAGSRAGQVIAGKYRILRLLGSGGMGEVYEAQHTVVGRRFAIKFLHTHLLRGRDAGARFLREAQSAGALDNEHIAAVLDFDTASDGTPFLVMEYLSGESLAATLAREGVLSVPRVIGILLQVCDGLARAHEAGIVHRDLKPDNLFVVERANGPELVKILDFGVAKWVGAAQDENRTHSGAVLGTPFYMAPEQARGEKSVAERTDIHALGVIAYELLSGQKPHPGAGYNAILAHILTAPVRPLSELRPDVPDAVVRVIERAMAYDPEARPASALALARELLPLAGREVSAFGAQFDLRRSTAATLGSATLGSDWQATRGPGDATQQGAVADVARDATPNRKATPLRWPWALLMAAAGLAWFLSYSKQKSPAPNSLDGSASGAALAHSSPIESKTIGSARPLAVAPETSLAEGPNDRGVGVTGPAASERPAALAAPVKKPALGTPKPPSVSSGSIQKPRVDAHQVTFDEKNPY